MTSFSTPCTWKVETDRGDTEFVLKGDEDIRRIGTAGSLLVADSHGIQFLIKDHLALDARSRRIVEERWLKVNDDSSGGMTLHELAADYGVSAERIRQIEVAAMKKMRKALEAA